MRLRVVDGVGNAALYTSASTMRTDVRDPFGSIDVPAFVAPGAVLLAGTAVDAASDGEWLDEQPDDTEAVEIIVASDRGTPRDTTEGTGTHPE